MRKIILASLFFCLTITTVFAQVATIDIATPYSNGISNNQVTDFDVNADGTILNNSASGGTAQLGNTAVVGNSNITAGSEADLILFQVTGNSGSDLEGTIEVFGEEAGLIIANPNGIICNGCGFINASKVDLVTGTSNFSGDDLTGFSIDNGSQLQVNVNGFVSDAVADELNLVSRDLRIRAQAKANNTLRLLAGNDTYNHTTNIITSDTTESNAHSIQITGDLSADSIVLISTELTTVNNGIGNFGADISANSLKLDSNGLFLNKNNSGVLGNIGVTGLLEINAKQFTNSANISADTFSLSIPNASYTNTGTVASDSLKLTIGDDFINNTATLNNFTFNNLAITTQGDYTQSGAINIAGDLNIQISGEASLDGNVSINANNLFFSAYDLYNQADFTISGSATFDIENDFKNGFYLGGYQDGGDIIADSFTATVKNKFNNENNAMISADNFNVIGSDRIYLRNAKFTANNLNIIEAKTYIWNDEDSTINANNFYVTINKTFYNYGTINVVDNFYVTARALSLDIDSNTNADVFNFILQYGYKHAGNVKVDNTFNLQVGDNFEYYSGDGNWNLNDTTLDFRVGGKFIYNNQYSDFVWKANNRLVADGHSSTSEIRVKSFTNSGDIIINHGLNIFVVNDFDYAGTINADALSLQVGGDFRYNDPNNDFVWNVSDSLVVEGSSFITANSFLNNGEITTDTLNLSVAGDFDYASDYLDNGNITATNQNFTARNGDFINDTSIDLVGNLGITADNFANIGGDIIADTFSLSVAGDFDYSSDFQNNGSINVINQNFTIRNGDFTNNTSIDLAGNLGITANKFTNTGGNITADTFSLSVSGDFDYASDYLNHGSIDATSYNFRVGGDFSYDDVNNDLDWGANDSLTVLGSVFATVDSFTNSGYIDIANSFNVTAGYRFYNQDRAIINANDFNVIAGNRFYNDRATINANDFNVTAVDRFYNWNGNATINADNFNVSAGKHFYSWTSTINANSFNLTVEEFYNEKNATLNATNNFNVTADNFTNTDGNIIADTLNLSVSGDFDYRSDFQNNGSINVINQNFTARNGDFINDTSIDLVGNLGITADNFANIGGDITADTFSLSVAGDFDYSSDFQNNGSINVINQNFTIRNGDFTNNTSIELVGNLGITADNFINTNGNITTDTFNLYVVGDFDYVDDFGTITTTVLNFNVGGDFSNNDAANDFTWGANDTLTVLGSAFATVDSFTNSGYIDIANSFNVSAGKRFYNERGAIINANDFNVTAVDRFYNWYGNATINADNFNVSAGKRFYSWTSTINANSFNLTVEEFYNEKNATLNATNNFNVTADNFTNTDGNINADIFALSVIGDFDYTQRGIINATIFNLEVGGDFSNNDAANDFTWGANDTLTVSGSASVTADSFTNRGTIAVSNSSFDITAASLNNSGTISANTTLNTTVSSTTNNSFTNTGGVLNATAFALSVAGDFDYVAEYLGNGTITTNTLNLNVGGDFSNNDASSDFVWGANDTLTVLGTASVVADSFNNSGTIAVSNSSFDITATDFTNAGTISANSFNTTVDTFINEANSTIAANECNIIYTTSYTDQGTITCIEVIDIARPDANGLSNNSYTDFNILNSGIVLNNSDSAGTSQLAGSVSANTNYNSGDAASLILAQITGNDISLLEGALEVFGAEAGVIIANPSGITCNACSFINASRVDLVTGSNYNVATDTFDSIANTNIALIDDGFDASSVGILNIQAGSFTNTGGLEANIFNLSVAGDFDYTNRGTITTNTLNLNVGGDFSNNDANNDFVWGANDTLTVLGTASVVADSFSNSGTITVSNSSFDITAASLNNSGTISANSFNTTVSSTANNSFTNTGGVLNATAFALSVAGDFDNTNRGTITTNTLNLNVGGDFSNNDASSDFVWGANDTLTVLGTASVVADSFNNSGNINVANSSFDITATDLTNTGTISANTTLNTTVSSTTNNGFTNTGGVLNANAFALSVAGDFDNTNRGTITTNTLNLNVGGDFSNNDASSDFVWGANDTLTVLGTASVVADSFNNSGTIAVSNSSFDITAASLNNSGTISANTTLNTTLTSTLSGSFDNTGGVLSADTVSLSVAGDFDDTKKGIINANYFNLTAGGSFINDDTNNDFVLAENDSLSISGDFTIATNNYIQSGMVDVAGALDISAIGDFTNNTGGDISADTLAITVGGIIDNDGTITTTSLTIDTDTIHNSGDITANSFLNINATNDVFSGGSIITNALDIEAGRNFANGGTITTNSLEITAGYTVINKGSIASDSLDVTTDDFFRNLTGGDISVASLNITAGGKVTNTATIDVSGILSITANNDSARDDDPAGAFFYVSNRGNITATDLNIAAVDNFYNRGNITADNFQITRAKSVFFLNEEIDSFVGTYDGGNISLNGDSSFIADGGIIENYGNIDLGNNNLTIIADSFINHVGATIDAATLNLDVSSFINDGTIDAVIVSDTTIDQ